MNDPVRETSAAFSGVAVANFEGLSLSVSVESDGWIGGVDGFGDADAVEAVLARAFAATVARVGLARDVATELGVTLTNEEAVRALNAEWRGKDRPTNVLSFPMQDLEPGDAPGLLLGDLVLARETLAREAAEEGKTFADHLCHLIVHGVLHCLGFDHDDPEDADEMEALEILILADLSIPDPYAASEPLAGGAGANPPKRVAR